MKTKSSNQKIINFVINISDNHMPEYNICPKYPSLLLVSVWIKYTITCTHQDSSSSGT